MASLADVAASARAGLLMLVGSCAVCSARRELREGVGVAPCPECGSTQVVVGAQERLEEATVDPSDPLALLEAS